MLRLRDIWRRHKKKVFLSVGVLGSGYVVYKLYAAHRRRVSELEIENKGHCDIDELIKAQLRAHFENVQRISDSMTLPYAMHHLRSCISEELDLSHLTERLRLARDRRDSLSDNEKLELWERLKILSFTRLALSLWTVTILSLYIKVQVNILGRHLYIDTARGWENPEALDEGDPFDRHGQQEFLATADYLSNYSIGSLILDMQRATAEVLKEMTLRDPFNTARFSGTIIQILELFMSIGGPHHWVSYLVPVNAPVYRRLVGSSNDFGTSSPHPDISKLDKLITEARSVLMREDFRNVAEIALRKVVETLTEEIDNQLSGESSPSSGVPLAKILPRVAQVGPKLLEEPSQNRYIQVLQNLPEVDLFFTLLYASMPPVP